MRSIEGASGREAWVGAAGPVGRTLTDLDGRIPPPSPGAVAANLADYQDACRRFDWARAQSNRRQAS